MDKPVGYLHIYGQYSWHDEARIVGTRIGLEELGAAIKHALKYGKASSDNVFVNDGEGYAVDVSCVADLGDDHDPPYIMRAVDKETAYLQQRAFEAEAKLSQMKRGPETKHPRIPTA